MNMVENVKKVKSTIMHQIKKWNDYQAHAGGQGSEVKFNLNTEAVMASARVSGRNKQGGSVSTFQCNKSCLLGNIDNMQLPNINSETTA